MSNELITFSSPLCWAGLGAPAANRRVWYLLPWIHLQLSLSPISAQVPPAAAPHSFWDSCRLLSESLKLEFHRVSHTSRPLGGKSLGVSSHSVPSGVACCVCGLISALLGEGEFGQHRNSHRCPSPAPPELQEAELSPATVPNPPGTPQHLEELTPTAPSLHFQRG